jgi:hypothetical protein
VDLQGIVARDCRRILVIHYGMLLLVLARAFVVRLLARNLSHGVLPRSFGVRVFARAVVIRCARSGVVRWGGEVGTAIPKGS